MSSTWRHFLAPSSRLQNKGSLANSEGEFIQSEAEVPINSFTSRECAARVQIQVNLQQIDPLKIIVV